MFFMAQIKFLDILDNFTEEGVNFNIYKNSNRSK